MTVAYGDSHTCVEEFDRFEPIKLSAIATRTLRLVDQRTIDGKMTPGEDL